MPFDPERFAGLAGFRFALRQFLSASESISREAGITAQQYQALLAIGCGPDPMTMKDLAEHLLLLQHTATQMVDRLQKAGWVDRVPSTTDGRSVELTLTETGAELLTNLAQQHLTEMLKQEPQLTRSLRRLKQNRPGTDIADNGARHEEKEMTALPRVAIIGLIASLTSAAPVLAAPPDGKDALAVLAVVKDVCLPLLKGAKIDTLAKAIGLRSGRDGWVMQISGKRRIEIDPPGGANPTVCAATIIHDPGAGTDILDGLSSWASSQSPPLQPFKTQEKATGALYQLTTSAWTGKSGTGDMAVVYAEDKTLNGKAVAGDLDQATLTVSLTQASS